VPAYDAVIVGGRCAGATTALLLARAGLDVLLVDRARFPSDTLSTHFIWPRGAGVLERAGLLGPLEATGCPPIREVGYSHEQVALTFTLPAAAWCARRTHLDALLVRAAVAAGAELLEGAAIEALLWTGGRVAGVRVNGRSLTAEGVVGADGRHSSVARLLGAGTLAAEPAQTCGYYAYWQGPERDRAEFHLGRGQLVYAWPTHDGLTLIYAGLEHTRGPEFRADIERTYRALVESVPALAGWLQRANRAETFRGTLGEPSYRRRPVGPGWALIGDAACHRDPTAGMGISEALLDAELLSAELIAGFDEGVVAQALAEYRRRRDPETVRVYELSVAAARLQPLPSALGQTLREPANEAARARFARFLTGEPAPPAPASGGRPGHRPSPAQAAGEASPKRSRT